MESDPKEINKPQPKRYMCKKCIQIIELTTKLPLLCPDCGSKLEVISE